MSQRSQLLSVQLPDKDGKAVPYYTYDGYLEEKDRKKIWTETNNFEQLKVSGAAIFGLVAFAVTVKLSRLPEDSRFPRLHSKAAPSQ